MLRGTGKIIVCLNGVACFQVSVDENSYGSTFLHMLVLPTSDKNKVYSTDFIYGIPHVYHIIGVVCLPRRRQTTPLEERKSASHRASAGSLQYSVHTSSLRHLRPKFKDRRIRKHPRRARPQPAHPQCLRLWRRPGPKHRWQENRLPGDSRPMDRPRSALHRSRH